MSVKPQEEWNNSFYFPDHQSWIRKRKLSPGPRSAYVHWRYTRSKSFFTASMSALELEKKNDLLPIVTNLVHRMDTLQSDLRRCYSRITALEETNSKLRTAVSNAMAPR